MKKLDNRAKNIGANVEPKAGERGLLSSNTADVRSSALGFTTKKEVASEDMALRYVASLLAKAYFDHKEDERGTANKKVCSNLLQSVHQRPSRRR